MFYGHKEITIDDKFRLVLPANYRNEFKGGVAYALLGLDPCLALYPKEVYEKKVAEIIELSDFNPQARNVKRNFLYNTFDLSIDSHNRILLPKPLVDDIKMGKKVVVAGAGDHLEIWDSALYEKTMSQLRTTFSADAESLLGK